MSARLRNAASLPVLLAVLALLAFAPASSASYDPVGAGTVKLSLDRGFRAFLKQHGVELATVKTAKLSAAAAIFPAVAGEVDPAIAKGTVELAGGLVFRAAGKHLPLDHLMVKTKRSPLLGRLGGGQLKLASATRIAFKREGFAARFTATRLKLTEKAATRLNKRLRLGDAFSQGQLLGALVSRTEPVTTAVLPTGRATIGLDSLILAKLDALHVSVNPIFPAEHVGPVFTFPVAGGGQIAPDGSAGTLRTSGDLEFLQLGGGQIFWHELWLDLGARIDSAEADIQPSPPYPGKQGRVGVLDLGAAAAFSADSDARTVTLGAAPLALQGGHGKCFNQAFAQGKGVFGVGEALGLLDFTARGQ
jgi:hypothetical protein